MIVNNILETIGNTPVLKLNSLFNSDKAEVYMKLERFNPGGSIKDRIALSMIEEAEKKGLLQPDSVIVEPTSGNTGIGLALVGAAKGYKVVLVMPESLSIERRKLMEVYGATFELTPRELFGIDCDIHTFPPITEPRPIVVLPPKMVALA